VPAAALFATVVSAGAAGPPPVVVSLSHTEIDQPISSGFVGLAIEYKTVPYYIGLSAGDRNTVFLQLLHDITDGAAPSIRIGGVSTDRSWWPLASFPQPIGITNALTPSWISEAQLLANETNAKLIMGLNLEANRVSIAEAEEWQLIKGLGQQRIAAFEIGNEPELYAYVPWYYVVNGRPSPWFGPIQSGTPVLARRRGYNFPIFTGEFTRFREGLGNVPLAGPATGNFHWLSQLPQFLAAEPGLSMVTFHRYGLNGCIKIPWQPSFPSVPDLLTAIASRGIMEGVSDYVALAHSRHIPFRIDEVASVTCNGKTGVSNTMASALWYLDTLFEMASAGVDGVNIHTYWNSPSSLFDFTLAGGRWLATVHPDYYGVLMFAQAAPPGSRLISLTVNSNGNPNIRAWATMTPNHQLHVVLLNDSLTQSKTVTLYEPWWAGSAKLERLAATNAYATTGVRLGGQSFGVQTGTGKLGGVSRISTVPPNHGAYDVTIPASNAAMLTWPVPSRPAGPSAPPAR
jgi:hypothetical protein